MTRILHSVTLPETQQPREPRQQQSEQSVLSLLAESQPAVETVASEQADATLEGTLAFRADVADKLAREIEQLATAGIGHMALRRADGDGQDPKRGYYEVASAEVSPVHAAGGPISEYRIGLNRAGTPNSHVRFSRPRPRDVDTPFSSPGVGDPLFVPPEAPASEAKTFDAATGTVSDVSGAGVVFTSDHANATRDLSQIDADALTGDRPGVISSPELQQDGRIDPRVWDDRNNLDKFDADGNTQWVKVLDTAHEFDGSPVLSDGRVRIRLRTDASSPLSNRVRAEQYSFGSWSTVVNSGSGTVTTVDFTDIRRSFVEAFVIDESGHRTRLRLVRDGEPEVFVIRDGATSPVDIEDLLQPVAVADRSRIPAVEERLLPRQETRQTS